MPVDILQVRTSTWDLPPASHTYGALVTKDSEGAGAGNLLRYIYEEPSANWISLCEAEAVCQKALFELQNWKAIIGR